VGLYLYCLGAADHPAPNSLAGIEGAPVRAETVSAFRAWVSDLERPPAPSLDRVRTHNAVVEAATALATPLPLRFGQWFDSPDALRQTMDGRAGDLERQLRHVAGALEYGVRVLDPEHGPDPPDRSSGTAYLESLARRARQDLADRDRGTELASRLGRWLGPLVRDERIRPAGGQAIVTIAHLVDRHDTGNYAARVRAFSREHARLSFVITGPWPPYGFTE
jgi:hypothetical protein